MGGISQETNKIYKVSMTKSMVPACKLICSFRLVEIRRAFINCCKKSRNPMIDRLIFVKEVDSFLSKASAELVFRSLAKARLLNLYEFFILCVVLAHACYQDKLHCKLLISPLQDVRLRE
jgi:hypothetical protein